MALEDVPHSLITDFIAQMGQGPGNTIIAPRAILLGHADNQRLQRLVDLWASWSLPVLGAIKLPGDQLPVPRQDRIGCDDRGDLGQCLLAQLLPELGQALALSVA